MFRAQEPQRTHTEVVQGHYRTCKPYLRIDFNQRCGYTDLPDFWFGGSRTFHIDHFKPRSTYPELANNYSNLIYCCSYVNISKSKDESDYLDPCLNNFNDHFFRDSSGNICAEPSSAPAVNMHKKLKLGLKRYSIIWMLETLQKAMAEIATEIEAHNGSGSPHEISLLRLSHELGLEFANYINYLKDAQ